MDGSYQTHDVAVSLQEGDLGLPFLLETLTSYVPQFVARIVAADPTPRTRPVAARFPGVVLFADISGFTPLADHLAERGPAGAEELTDHLNTYFGQLIDLIGEHGGDVIKFAGDGLLALWPATTEDLPTAARRAAGCGLAAQEALDGYEVAAGLRLSMRIGVGAGEVLALVVGGRNGRWEMLVAGEPLTEMAAAEGEAQPGEVVLAPSAWALVEDSCMGAATPGGNVRLTAVRAPLPGRPVAPVILDKRAEPALRAFVPEVILSRLDAEQTGWLAELRRVTVVFLNLIGLDYEAPEARDQVQTALRTIQEAISYYEGTIRQFMVDDKGTVLMAAFGLPPYTHEDDAARAVQAAQLMQANLRQSGLRSAVGITSGRTFCGPMGSGWRREYTLIGAVVNLAARLMQAAPDTILCDTATYQAAQARLAFEPLAPITVKGKTDPVPVYRPQGQARLVLRGQMMVGRMAERALLGERVQEMRRGEGGGVVVIEGEAGIGKSRLVEEVQAHAESLGLTVLAGAGDAIEKAAAYHAWRTIFSRLLHLDALADAESRRAHVLAQLAGSQKYLSLAPLLNDVLPLDLPPNPVTKLMSGDVRAGNIRDLLLRLLGTAARQAPILLVIEDAQWLDSPSWDLTLAASRYVPEDGWPMLMLVVTRPPTDPPPPGYTELRQLPATLHLSLETLSREDTMSLVTQRLGVVTLPEAVANLIHERAEGNPFFSEELAYALRDTGLIQIEDGVCRVAPDAGDLAMLALPDTLHGVITSRIDRLPPAHQLTLKVASVIGRIFAFRTLRDIHPLQADRGRLAAELATLERLDMTPLHTPEPDLNYIFKHVITREVSYNLMLFAQRRELHRAVAEWYERTYAEDITPFYPLLVHHWSKAEVPAKTLEYLEKAAEHALRNYANQEAVDFLQEALRLADAQAAGTGPGALTRARWERRLGEAHYCLGHLPESRIHLERALIQLGWPVPNRIGMAAHKTELATVLHATPLAHDPAARSEAARAYERLAQIHYVEHEARACLYAAVRTRTLVADTGPSSGLARGYANSCLAAGIIGRHDRAMTYLHEARALAEQTGRLSTQAYVYQVTGI